MATGPGIQTWAALLLLGLLSVRAQAGDHDVTPPESFSTEEVVRRLLDRSGGLSNRLAGARYTFRRATAMEELDSQGRVKERTTKEHAVTAQGLEQSSRLVSVDGVALPEAERQREQQKEEGNREKFASRRERPARQAHQLDRELLQRFQYRLLGTESMNGRSTYVLAFESQDKASGGKIADKILARLQGRIWVDAEEFEPVRLEADLGEPVAVGLFLAVLDEFRTVVIRRRLPSGWWVDEQVNLSVGGRKLIQRFRGRMELHQDDFTVLPPAALP